jgi:putative tricarboxylic transport membrane protein
MPGIDFLAEALTPFHIALALAGVVAGTVIGSLPGLTATMAIAVLVPLTFSMETASALIMMGAIYTGAIYGGAYSAILLNTPGTPSAIGTTFDGFPMAKRGDGDLAVTLACLASVFGGLVGAAFLLGMAPPLADVALAFGPVEYFWLAVFGLTLIAALSEGSIIKGLIGACFGLLLSTVGIAEVSADVRFTFGSEILLGGIEAVSALIGLYCVPVLIDLVATPERHLKVSHGHRGIRFLEALRISWKGKFNLIRSSVVGTFVGILPGAGGSIAGLVAYSEARRSSKRSEFFGTGEPEGIQATESANNATVGGGFIPTLVLGIPGTPPDAVVLGALLVQGVKTGPELFTSGEGSIVYTFIYGLFLATFLMLPTGLLIGRYAYRFIITVPKAVLVPTVAFMTIIGSFAIRNSVSDVIIMIALGVIGWILNRFGFAPSPIVLGLILCRIAEQGFVQGWTIGKATGNVWADFFGQPISMGIIFFILLSLLYPLLAKRLKLARGSKSNGE